MREFITFIWRVTEKIHPHSLKKKKYVNFGARSILRPLSCTELNSVQGNGYELQNEGHNPAQFIDALHMGSGMIIGPSQRSVHLGIFVV